MGHLLWRRHWHSICSLGNPFDMLQKLESSSKVKEQSLLDFGKALFVFLPPTLSAMFILNFIYIAIRIRSLAFRVHAYSILKLFLLYYVLALVESMSGSRVMWSYAQIFSLLFGFGGGLGLMMLTGHLTLPHDDGPNKQHQAKGPSKTKQKTKDLSRTAHNTKARHCFC